MAPSVCKVFISYNRADCDWAEWIAGVIERGGYQPIIQAWDFRPGQNFVLRMREAMVHSDLTIAVLSEHYLKAEFTQSEWAAAFARDPTGKKRKLIPVRVAKCRLPPMLSEIIYIDLGDRPEQDAERALLDGLKPSGKPAQPSPFPGKRAEPSISAAPFPPNLARLRGVPDLPPHYLPREEVLIGLKQKLLSVDASVAITGQGHAFGVQGMGGIGKTVLAAALAHDSEVRQAFSDGIYWLTIGQKPDVLALQNQLLRQLTGSKETLNTEQESKDALREALEGRSALVVVDDAWKIDHADAFSVTAPPARLLITTRNNEVLVGVGAEEHRIGVLSPRDALKMLAQWVGEQAAEKLPPEATEVVKECGYLPLALAMIGAMVHSRPTGWTDALTRLRRADLQAIKKAFPGYPYPDLIRAIEVSIEALEETDRERYLDLAVFPEDQPIPEKALCVLWNLDRIDTRDCMTRFVARSLATWDTDGSSLLLHDLQGDLVRKRREKELPRLHLRLVEGWNASPLLPDAYTWRWIAFHLIQAGRKEDLRRLLLNFNYLEAKLTSTDRNALIADYDYLPEDKELKLVQSAIRLSAHVFVSDAQQLAGQLTGRLVGDLAPDIQALLKQAGETKPWPWLRPLTRSLTPAGGVLVVTLQGHRARVNAVAVTHNGRLAVSGSNDRSLRVWDLSSDQILFTLEGHTDSISAVAVTLDGRRAVSASYDRTLRIWDLNNGQLLRTLEGHADRVTAVAVTPDGYRAVSASEDETLRVWDLESAQILRTLKGHPSPVWALALTRDGRRAVAGSYDGMLRVWNLENGKSLRTFGGHADPVWAVGITPDGLNILSGSGDGKLQVWEFESGRPVRVLEGHTGAVNALAVTPDGRTVSGSEDRALRLWDLKSGQTVRPLIGHRDSVTAVTVTVDGCRAISASADRSLRVWNLRSQTGYALTGLPEQVTEVAVAAIGSRVVSASKDGTLQVWDLNSGEMIRMLKGHAGSVTAIAVTPNGRRALSASVNERLLWDLETGQTLRRLGDFMDSALAVALTSDGRRAVSALSDRTLQLWDLDTGKTMRWYEGQTSNLTSVTITPDGHRVVSAAEDRTLRVWDSDSGQELRTLKGHTGMVCAIVVTPDARRAVSASADKTLRVWDLETGSILRTLKGHTDSVTAVAITPDGRRVVSGSSDRTLRLWDVSGGRSLHTFEGHMDPVTAVAIMPDGRGFVSVDQCGKVRVWELGYSGHAESVTVVAVTPDCRYVVSGSYDHTLQVWDLASGQAIRTLEGHTDSITGAGITPDGNYVVSASNDRTLRVWELKSGRSVRILKGHKSAVNAVAVTADGRRAISVSNDQTLRVWDLDIGGSMRTLEDDSDWLRLVAMVPELADLIGGKNEQGGVSRAEVEKRVWELGHTSAVNAVAVTADGHRAVSASKDYTLRVWDLDGQEELTRFMGEGRMFSCIFASDNRTIISGDEFGQVHFLQLIESDESKPSPADVKIPFLQPNQQTKYATDS